MSIIDTLITDRTQADVTKLKSLLSKPKAMWTNEEWSEFLLAKDKGAYNAADLNRVQEAMEYLAERFRGYGYNVPEIKRPSITEIIPGTSRLPEGYTELEYIQSTGTQHINTLFKPNQDTRVVVDAQIADEQSGEGHLFSARDNATNGPFWIMLWQSDAYKTRYATQGLKTFDGVESRGRHVFDFNKNVISIDGVSITFTAATFQLNTYLPLFCRFTGTTVDCITKMKLYSCQIYDNGTLVRDFVPCINPSNEVGLYDIVNGEFYGNAGTGTFMEGAELESVVGGSTTKTIVRDYWKIGDIPRKAQMDTYLSNLGIIRGINEVMKSTPEIPGDMEGLLHTEANDIEQILFDVDYLLSVMVLNWFYTAEVFCGEV